jgi:hypothetical protein
MRRTLLLGIALLVAACRGDQPTAPSNIPSVSGSYQLTTVDGQGLPVTVIDLGTYRANVASGTLTLSGNGTYALEIGYQLDDGIKIRAAATTEAGTWTAANGAISLASTQGSLSRSGTVSGNAVTLQSSERLLVFRK